MFMFMFINKKFMSTFCNTFLYSLVQTQSVKQKFVNNWVAQTTKKTKRISTTVNIAVVAVYVLYAK